jgi:hypothetical protein
VSLVSNFVLFSFYLAHKTLSVLKLFSAQHLFCFAVNKCMNMGDNTPNFMAPATPGGLLEAMSKTALPPALAPMPLLTGSDVAEPPLPPAGSTNGTTPTHSRASRTHSRTAHILVLVALAMLSAFLRPWR